jgi:hypothetical protein
MAVRYGSGRECLVDTRNPTESLVDPSLTGGASTTIVAINQRSLLATASPIDVNVTQTGAQRSGHLKVYPGGTSAPSTSSIRWQFRALTLFVAQK